MFTRKAFFAVLVLSATVAVLYSCKDMGNELSRAALTATSLSVTLSPSGQAVVTISGGSAPYSISSQPDPTIASATLTNNVNGTASLEIQAVAANVSGTTNVKVKDSGASSGDVPASEKEIEISVRVTAAQVSFSTDVQPIFTARCVNAGCHPGGGAPFPLVSSVSFTNLVNVVATTGPCAGLPRVKPSSPDSSALVKRLEGSCGAQMPLGGSALQPSQVTLIRTWIAQGAQNN